jgi:hypothetical protein
MGGEGGVGGWDKGCVVDGGYSRNISRGMPTAWGDLLTDFSDTPIIQKLYILKTST